MKKVVVPFLLVPCLCAILLNSCGGDNGDGTGFRKANGPVSYGGIFKFNEVENFRSLYPLDITEEVSSRIASQIYEGLVKFDQKTLEPKLALASKVDPQDSGKRYVFTIRKGVKFHDDACFDGGKGREMTIQDVKWCYDRLCEANSSNQLFSNTFKDRVVGATEYYNSTLNKKPLAGGVSGVKVVNDSMIQIDLIDPHPNFLSIMCTPGCWVYPKEAWAKYGYDGMKRKNCVGTGPFKIENITDGQVVLLTRNPNYYMIDQWGNQLPYLDKIRIEFQKERTQEMLSFQNQKLDMVYRVPVEMIPQYMGQLSNASTNNAGWQFQSDTALSLTYYGFQNKKAPFDNVKVRQAFCYAINRDLIATSSLQGDVLAGSNGVVPPCIPGYGSSTVGFTFDEAKAKQLLADAGYPGGKGFPETTLQINLGGVDRNKVVAEAIHNQLKATLNIDVKVEALPQPQHLELIETGKASFWRTGWIADYPDPDNFLVILYGKNVPANLSDRSYLNSVRYINPRYDSLYEAAMKESDVAKRYDLYRQAERIAIDDAAICPIYYEINDRLLQKHVMGFDMNPMEFRDFTSVWFDPTKIKK